MTFSDYWLKGWTSGTCGCSSSLGCACWRSSSPCSQFVAYCIESGSISQIDVSGAILIRLIATAGEQSTLYLDSSLSFLQQQALVAAFTGRMGGKLANLARLAPIQLPPKLAPIQACRHQQESFIGIGNLFQKTNLKAIPFECQS
ncbi:DUF1326 domain-containing protein [Cyanobacteria bacterium FACHB-502]|uniref:DUF1326 domain-containing protein n=1 Tax=Leptolyngbya sp. GB1-A1 TaxID=2933908 RepID=UPI0019A1DE00|nr:DUF1326 domain-containing protein [Cyanobacteria bacterium FACHB-502]